MTTTIGLFYGSTEGATAAAAELIKDQIEATGLAKVDLFDVAYTELKTMEGYDTLILGISTWDIGQLQADWAYRFAELDKVNLAGKKAALFGLGDQYGYPDSYLDAMDALGEKVIALGGELVGFNLVDDSYEFEYSLAVIDDVFIGLALDEENQSDLTQKRVRQWVQTLLLELGLAEPVVA